jgi:hypothetical protein
MTFVKQKYGKIMRSISKNFQGKYRREIDLGVFDEILGIFIGFIYVRYFIEYTVVQESDIARVYLSLLLSLIYILLFVALSHSNNDNFKFLVAFSLTVVSFTAFQGLAFIYSRFTDIEYASFIQLPGAEIFQVTWFACFAWFFLKFVAEQLLKKLQSYPIEMSGE